MGPCSLSFHSHYRFFIVFSTTCHSPFNHLSSPSNLFWSAFSYHTFRCIIIHWAYQLDLARYTCSTSLHPVLPPSVGSLIIRTLFSLVSCFSTVKSHQPLSLRDGIEFTFPSRTKTPIRSFRFHFLWTINSLMTLLPLAVIDLQQLGRLLFAPFPIYG